MGEREDEARAAQQELEAALKELEAQEKAYNDKKEELKKKSEEGGVVSRNKPLTNWLNFLLRILFLFAVPRSPKRPLSRRLKRLPRPLLMPLPPLRLLLKLLPMPARKLRNPPTKPPLLVKPLKKLLHKLVKPLNKLVRLPC